MVQVDGRFRTDEGSGSFDDDLIASLPESKGQGDHTDFVAELGDVDTRGDHGGVQISRVIPRREFGVYRPDAEVSKLTPIRVRVYEKEVPCTEVDGKDELIVVP